jgi:hypothetical protein
MKRNASKVHGILIKFKAKFHSNDQNPCGPFKAPMPGLDRSRCFLDAE